MNFRSFYLFFFFLPPAPEAPSAQFMCDTKKRYFHCNSHIPVCETKVKTTRANLSRAVEHPWKGNGFVEGTQLYLL